MPFLRRMTMLLAASALLVGSLQAQCPGFRNTMSFSQGTPNLYFWSARVGDRISSGASSGSLIYSTCAATNCTTITAPNITSSTFNSGPDQGINCCLHTNLWDAQQDHRFMIITSSSYDDDGYDKFTQGSGGGMLRIPEGYQSSIRLGDPRCTRQPAATVHSWSPNDANKSSEALFYTMYVTTENALLFINYAVVGRCYNHTPEAAGEFLIRVVKRNDDGTWPNQPINDNLWFRISAPPIPASGIPDAPWQMGRPCSATTAACDCSYSSCAYVYKPWSKVAINLNDYIGQFVRIEMYTSDCIYTVDPIYAYISGDYQAMILRSSGCPSPESSVVDSLVAPPGMISYRWYVSSCGPLTDEQRTNSSYVDTASFRQVWPPDDGESTDSIYAVRLEDFVPDMGEHAGDTVSEQTFMCIMTSALDPTKPFSSKIYANVVNRRPLVDYGYEAHCDTSVSFHNASIVYVREGQADDSTHWVFYSDTLGTQPFDTVYANDTTYTFPAPGYYGVRLFVSTDGQSPEDVCTAAKFFTVKVIGEPPADFTMSTRELCESNQLVLRASDAVRQLEGATLRWAMDDSLLADTTPDVHFYLPVGEHTITLTVTNSDGCSSTTSDSLMVFGQPHIDLSSVTSAICLGDSVTLSAAGNISYSWNSAPYDPAVASAEGQASFTVSPTVSTTYYLLPAEDNPCSIEGAEVYIEVIPYPTPTIRTSSPRVNIENATLMMQDVSPYSVSSHWQFSDGGTADGMRVSHTFSDLNVDSVGITLNACNRLDCCADTTIHLPIEVTTVWFPNTFTPDAETNNLFGPHTTLTFNTYELFVYNRQGLLVYHTTDPAAAWNGVMDNGGSAPQGAYTWFCRYAYSADATYTARGTVTVLR